MKFGMNTWIGGGDGFYKIKKIDQADLYINFMHIMNTYYLLFLGPGIVPLASGLVMIRGVT